ncbi:hypothetical protein MD588_09355 [Photobacterium sp. SDRW27]|uniref:hypothetical protein n=1 Tax=Photobacterium obscurum TaxID=2829490 RepID=UPI002244C4B8|nr:hypothetical protein [Photobacterium obscurum]MCW8329013.1 hypothetical protein [Photobacterium obscurum]
MSLVKVQNKALQKLMMPAYQHGVQPDIAFSPGKGGLAARLHRYSLHHDLSKFDAGARVTISRLSKCCMFLCANAPLELKASYEMTLLGCYQFAGYLTPTEHASHDTSLYCYQFHSNTWLTDEQLMRLVVDFD